MITKDSSITFERRCYVVEESENPSSDYFVIPALKLRELKIIRCKFDELPAHYELDGSVVVFVRYVPIAWLKLINYVRPNLYGLVFFMDDDVLDLSASSGMPFRYRYKLARLAAFKKRWLIRSNAELWVSVKYLQDKYSKWHPRLILPVPETATVSKCRVFYHGTASHKAEIRWLHSVIVKVMNRSENVVFEVVGGKNVYHLYRGIPRVNVIHPMQWDSYNAFLDMRSRNIGLVPQLKLPFNSARSYTKFFDITRCGAAGIYSSSSACAEVIDDGMDGLILDMDEESWVEVILKLAGNAELRKRIIENAEKKLEKLSAKACANNQKIIDVDS